MHALILIARVINHDHILVSLFSVTIVTLLILFHSGSLLMNIYYLNCTFLCGGCYGTCSITGNVHILTTLWVLGLHSTDQLILSLFLISTTHWQTLSKKENGTGEKWYLWLKKWGKILMNFLQCLNNQCTTNLHLVSYIIKISIGSIKIILVFENSIIFWTYLSNVSKF